MDCEDFYAATLAALDAHASKERENTTRLGGMMNIPPFDAVTFDDEPCRAVGVVLNADGECLDFVVIKECAGGELIPTTESSLWKRAAA